MLWNLQEQNRDVQAGNLYVHCRTTQCSCRVQCVVALGDKSSPKEETNQNHGLSGSRKIISRRKGKDKGNSLSTS